MEIKTEDDRLILICAFRYALGRKTYVSHSISDIIIDKWSDLASHEKELFKREITQAIELNRAGMDCDVNSWKRILDLDEELV